MPRKIVCSNIINEQYFELNRRESVEKKYFENFKMLTMHGEPDSVVEQYHAYVFSAPMQQKIITGKPALPMPS